MTIALDSSLLILGKKVLPFSLTVFVIVEAREALQVTYLLRGAAASNQITFTQNITASSDNWSV